MKLSTPSMAVFTAVLVLGSQSAAWCQTLPDGASSARLIAPLAQPKKVLIDGRFWNCSGDVCGASRQDSADSQPLWMECAHAAAEFGAFAEYRTGSETLNPAKLARCNTRAKRS